MSNNPFVSIILPVYNGDAYIKESITSILNQSYGHFELIIMNDASTDTSFDIIKSIQDKRIRLINNDENMGLIKTLNKGLSLSNGKYIARMDQDDIALNKRIEEQVNFMEKNPKIGISGTYIDRFSNNKRIRIAKVPTKPEIIKCLLLFKNCLAHPSVIIRKDVLEKNQISYNILHTAAEDYGLWQNASFYTVVANLPKVLLKYRENPTGMTSIADSDKNKNRRKTIYKIIYKQGLTHFGFEPSDKELELHYLCASDDDIDIATLSDISKYLVKLKLQNKTHPIYNPFYFNSLLNRIWFKVCMKCRGSKIMNVKIYFKSELSKRGNPLLFRSF
ncbi:MAG: hypothetical protein A2Y40_09285 [Candidatus Margulisbacteria bacterium GWF2_35_9]|nr:MAG: hypothetical protein A2Y40_09285 [Candidatus Margulisbacteria bacterium GWF2_35_9]